MTRHALALLITIAACGGTPKPLASTQTRPVTIADQMLALLPNGAQIVVEVDLARLRANPVVGAIVTRALTAGTFDNVPGAEPGATTGSPFGIADTIVLAAYGVGTSEAATVTIISAKTEVPGATRLSEGLYALGPADWVAQLEARAALSYGGGEAAKLAVPADLLALRDRAMPAGAPGASLRVTARLPFDARVALARQTGLESAPAQLSVWADVVDDLAIIIDADALDPGERATKKSLARLTALIKGALGALATDPTTRALGLPKSIANARLVARGSWVRTIIAVGPKHLQRVVERASALLKGSS